jgi:hypothetical protein
MWLHFVGGLVCFHPTNNGIIGDQIQNIHNSAKTNLQPIPHLHIHIYCWNFDLWGQKDRYIAKKKIENNLVPS